MVSVRGLRKAYGPVEALRGVDLDIHRGEVLALLGPNGAGKSTATEILEGHRRRTSGDVLVLGEDPQRPSRAWRSRIGIVLQSCQVEPELTVEEALAMYAGYYPHPRSVSETIELVGLADARRRRAGTLSGGQQRRLDVGIGLIGDPELLFLDEPTTGFDPAARHQFWRVIADFSGLGMTVLLTTHDMEEARTLANRVAVLAAGRIVGVDTPDRLGGTARQRVRITFGLPSGVSAVVLPSVPGATVMASDGAAVLTTDHPAATLRALLEWAGERGVDLTDIEVRRPTLEEMYLRMTGVSS